MKTRDINKGTIASVRSSVVDTRFPGKLPAINHILRAEGRPPVVIDVLTHLSSEMVRRIALTSTQGLAMDSTVIDTGLPLQVPVGEKLAHRQAPRSSRVRSRSWLPFSKRAVLGGRSNILKRSMK